MFQESTNLFLMNCILELNLPPMAVISVGQLDALEGWEECPCKVQEVDTSEGKQVTHVRWIGVSETQRRAHELISFRMTGQDQLTKCPMHKYMEAWRKVDSVCWSTSSMEVDLATGSTTGSTLHSCATNLVLLTSCESRIRTDILVVCFFLCHDKSVTNVSV